MLDMTLNSGIVLDAWALAEPTLKLWFPVTAIYHGTSSRLRFSKFEFLALESVLPERGRIKWLSILHCEARLARFHWPQ